MNTFSSSQAFIIASMLTYASSLALPAYFTDATHGFGEGGITLLMIGWIGAPVQWFANPSMLVGFGLYPFSKKVLSASFFATSLALMLTFSGVHSILCNEAGRTCAVLGYRLGYWLWLLSAGFVIVGALAMRSTRNASKRTHEKSAHGSTPASGSTTATGASP